MDKTAAMRPTPVWRRPHLLKLLVIALLGEFGIAILNVSAMPVFLEKDRHFGGGLIGAVFVAFLLSEALFKPFAGHWADKHGRRLFLIGGPFIFIFTPLLTMLVPQTWGLAEPIAFVCLRVIDGIAAAMLWPAAYAAVGESVEGHERGAAMGLLNLCFMLGLAFGLPAGGVVNDLFGSYHASFYLASAVFIITVVAAYKFAPVREPAPDGEAPHGSDMRMGDMWQCMKSIPYVLIIGFVAFLSIGFPAAIWKLFALNVFHLSESQVGVAVLVAALTMALFSSYLGTLGERIGRYKAVRSGLLLCTIGAWPIGLGHWFEHLHGVFVVGVGAVLIGLGFLLAIPAWYSSVSHIDEKRTGSYLGAVMTAQGIGAIIGAAIGSKLYGWEPFAPFLACAISLSCAFILSMLALERKDSTNAS